MYEKFYGLKDKPFQLNPDPEFYFNSSQHRRAMAFIEYGLHQSEGFIVITGEVGAGKTTIVRNLLSHLDPAKVVAANIVTTQLEADDLLRLVGASFGIRTRDIAKSDLLLAIEAVLASHARDGKRSLLIVDEAQNLSPRAVEELRMLSNFQLGTHALLQSFLVGQPEFRSILQSPELDQLRQRVIAACHIGPLNPDETRKYIEHRLRLAGRTDKPRIVDVAFAVIHESTGGVPRRINLLCDRVLLAGYLADSTTITVEMVREVATDIAGESESPAAVRRRSAGSLGPSGEASVLKFGVSAMQRAPGTDVVDPAGAQEPDWLRSVRALDERMQGMQETLDRVERGNQTALSLIKRFLDWMRNQDTHNTGPR